MITARPLTSTSILSPLALAVSAILASGATAQQQTVRLVGTVADAHGRPLPEVDVQVVGPGTVRATDEHGDFELLVREGRVLLRLRKFGYAERAFSLEAPVGGGVLSVGTVALDSSVRGLITVTGTVRDLETDEPIVGVGILIGGRTVAISNDRGLFTLNNVPTGRTMLGARRVGYRAHATEFWFAERLSGLMDDGSSIDINLTLAPLAVRLDDIIVEGEAVSAVRHLRRFAERRRQGQGHFFDATEIEEREPVFLSDMLRKVPGVRVEQGGSGMMSDKVIRVSTPRSILRPCGAMQVWVDGIMMMGGFEVDSFDPKQIAALEVYTRPAQMPPEFNRVGSACGVVAIWTK